MPRKNQFHKGAKASEIDFDWIHSYKNQRKIS